MQPNSQKEIFSHAYIHALAAVAGLSYAQPFPDEDSVDCILKHKGLLGAVRSPQLDLQLKATSKDIVSNGFVGFQIEQKNYDELRYTDLATPRILVVVLVPKDVSTWLDCSTQDTLMKATGYWYSLRGMPPLVGQESLVLPIPVTNLLTPDTLMSVMQEQNEVGVEA